MDEGYGSHCDCSTAPHYAGFFCEIGRFRNIWSSKGKWPKFHNLSETICLKITFIILEKLNCSCQHRNGGLSKNDITCSRNGIEQHYLSCDDDSWCTESSFETLDDNDYWKRPVINHLCQEGIVRNKCSNQKVFWLFYQYILKSNLFFNNNTLVFYSCGNSTLYPNCFACPRNDDVLSETWCGGNCHFTENECKFCK